MQLLSLTIVDLLKAMTTSCFTTNNIKCKGNKCPSLPGGVFLSFQVLCFQKIFKLNFQTNTYDCIQVLEQLDQLEPK